MNEMESMEDRRRELSDFANAGGQPQQPHGHALVRATTGLADRIIGAQQVAVYRDEGKIFGKLTALAARAGTDWFYRFPVKKDGGGTDWIEGPSIKLANDIARVYGNNVNEVRELDVGDAWIFYARFTDIETGFSMERAYRQRKSQSSLKTKDADRRLDIAYQIGQSKAIRNCIVNALQTFADFAFEEARNSLVDKIGKDLPKYRQGILDGLGRLPVDVRRVERVIGRASKDWLAHDVAQVIAMAKSIADGMATADETFPPLDPPKADEPKAEPAKPDEPKAETSGEAQGTGGEAAKAPAAGDPAPVVGGNDAIVAAHKRGVEWRAQNGEKKAMPGEFRHTARMKEQIAWTAGFDGNPLPTFPTK
jgi:hypothetical protein